MTNLIDWFLSGSTNAVSSERDPADDFWYEAAAARASAAGMSVNEVTAMRSAVVYACVLCITETVAMLPFGVFERTRIRDHAARERRDDHWLTDLLTRRANENMNAFSYKAAIVQHVKLRGNHYSLIERNAAGTEAINLWPFNPDRVRYQRDRETGRLVYFVRMGDGEPETVFSQEDILHVRSPILGRDGIGGIDPIRSAMLEPVGLALAAQDYGARFFKNDATPPTVITHPGHFKDDESRANFVAAWRRAHAGGNRHAMAVLEDGMTIDGVGLSNEQAQFLETRRYQDVDIARLFRVPPHKVGILDRATFSNIEQQAIDFVGDSILPILVNLETCLDDRLIQNPNLFTRFNPAGLLRGDQKARYESYAIGRNWGWLSANDVRVLEDMNPIGPEGDQYLMPTNMIPASDVPEPSGQNRDGPQGSSDRDDPAGDDLVVAIHNHQQRGAQ